MYRLPNMVVGIFMYEEEKGVPRGKYEAIEVLWIAFGEVRNM